MKRPLVVAGAMLALSAVPALAHRVDEYLQAATLLVSSNRVKLELRLVPGMEIAQKVLDTIDLDHNTVLSDAEQRTYALQVMRDLRFTLDARPIELELASVRFDGMTELREGTGEIQLIFAADLPQGGEHRRLGFENRHRPWMSVYLVNSLMPEDPGIIIKKQQRNYRQSVYELEYVQHATAAADSAGGVLVFWLLAVTGAIVAAADELRRRLIRRKTGS